MTEKKVEDVVFAFGPGGQYSLHIPIKDIESTEITGQTFIQAGMALVLYAREQLGATPPTEMQKLFDWMLNSDEKTAEK